MMQHAECLPAGGQAPARKRRSECNVSIPASTPGIDHAELSLVDSIFDASELCSGLTGESTLIHHFCANGLVLPVLHWQTDWCLVDPCLPAVFPVCVCFCSFFKAWSTRSDT